MSNAPNSAARADGPPAHNPAQPRADASPGPLVLLGAGLAHLQVLWQMAQSPWTDVPVVLVTPYARQMHAGMVAGFVTGHYALDDCTLELEHTVQRIRIRWIQGSVRSLDANQQTLTLDDGSSLRYAWLSIDTDPVQNRTALEAAIPGARTHGLFVRPLDVFGKLWPQVAAMGDQRALRIAVIGAGATGLELAMAVRQRLPNAAISLLCGKGAPGPRFGAAAQQRIHAALHSRNITVLHDRAVGLHAGEVMLASGATLACDVPLLATGAQAPEWLLSSGLALDAQGHVVVDACQRSNSHPHVFASGANRSRSARASQQSVGGATREGKALAHNLAAAQASKALQRYQPPERTLQLLACGNQTAIANWGNASAEGRWVWWLKSWLDQRAMHHLAAAAAHP